MIIKVRQIPLEGTEYDFTVPAQQLVAELPENDPIRTAVQAPGQVQVFAEKLKDTIQLNGAFQSPLAPCCDRCLETYSLPLELPIHVTCVPAASIQKDDADEVEDEGVFPYKGDEIDLLPIVRAHLILNLPMTFHCREDCKGLCPKCGTNLNQGDCSCQADAAEKH